MRATFYVIWSVEHYIAQTVDEFDSEGKVEDFLAGKAKEHERAFHFRVVEGREVEFKPAQIVQTYRRA